VHIREVPLREEYIQVFESEGIGELYPPQEEAIKFIFEGKNVVMTVPTASGKTLVGYLAILRAFERGMKSAYIVPLRALAMEKYEEMKRFEKFGMRISLSIGDYDRPAEQIKSADLIIATSEKMDSLLRHDPDLAYDLGVVVVDEIHLLGEESRGPTLEMVITRIRDVNEDTQIVALSATIGNAEELADWLDAELIYSEFRPVPLKLGVYSEDVLVYEDGTEERIPRDTLGIGNLIKRRIEAGGQVLVFVNRRKSAESLATRLARKVEAYIENKEELEEIAKSLLDRDSSVYSEKLSNLLVKGVSFHHAGLSNVQRKVVEDSFKKGLLKVIVATPTLAAGINLPSRTVIVRDVTRFDGYYSAHIPVMEVKQMLGRAGRPKYDSWGEGIIYSKSRRRAEEYMERYIKGEVESIESQLSSDRALRIHILALIASDMTHREDELKEFFEKTFYGFKMPIETLEKKIERILDFLESHEFISRKRILMATTLGRRVSDLYIDPYSAIMFEKCYEMEYDEFCILHTISSTPDMMPIYARRGEIDELLRRGYASDLAIDEWDVDQERFLSALKTASMLEDWINEVSQDSIVEKYGIGPGDIHSRVELADWLLYSFSQIGQVVRYPHWREVERLRVRVKYGIREELMPLISIKGVGRVRARRLYDSGFTSIEKLKLTDEKTLSSIPGIGEKLAREIIRQVKE
jgi:helicase